MLHNINYKDVGVEMNKNRKEIEIIDIEKIYMFAKSEIEKLKKESKQLIFKKRKMKKKSKSYFY